MAKKFLTFEHRKAIEKGLKEGLTFVALQKQLGFHHTTIRSEIQLNQLPTGYTAESAEIRRKERMKAKRWDDIADK